MVMGRSLSLTVASLDAMTEEEKVLLVQLCRCHNVIQIVRRWILASGNSGASVPERHAKVTQHSLAMRTLCGILNESWAVLRLSYFGTQLSRTYDQKLSQPAAEALSKLKSYFSSKNVIAHVRNKHIFHVDRDEALSGLAAVPSDVPLILYIANATGNSLYYLAEEIFGQSLLRSIKPLLRTSIKIDESVPLGLREAVAILDGLQTEILDISSTFDTLIANVLGLLLTENLPQEILRNGSEFVVKAPTRVDELHLPFFVRPRNEHS